MTPTVDGIHFRHVLGHFASGLTVVTGMADDVPLGFTCQSFMSVSLEPQLIAICPGKEVGSWQGMAPSGSFSVNILREDQEVTARLFATRGADKFGTAGWTPGPNGNPHLDGTLAWLDCQVVAVHDGGDHEVVLAEVSGLEVVHDGRPLLFFRGGYRRLDD